MGSKILTLYPNILWVLSTTKPAGLSEVEISPTLTHLNLSYKAWKHLTKALKSLHGDWQNDKLLIQCDSPKLHMFSVFQAGWYKPYQCYNWICGNHFSAN